MDALDLDNIENLTVDQVDAAIDRTIDRLSVLQGLSAALRESDHRRIKRLIEDYHSAKREEKVRGERSEDHSGGPGERGAG